jgi:hypothetical protein
MRKLIRISLIISLLFSAQLSYANCPPKDNTLASLVALKANKWVVEDRATRQQVALSLLPCLSNPNPLLRDEIAFEALSFWLRGELLDSETVQQIRSTLLQKISASNIANDDGYTGPFAALVLAEVARVDRRKPFMNASERQEMVTAAAQFLSKVSDYRGYDDAQGWRHGVAHGADWLMQLALNSALTKEQHKQILTAIGLQVRNENHFYIYGEGERLMAPVFYLGLNPLLSAEEWDAWFDTLLNTELDLSKMTQKSLARKHNLTAFLSAFYLNLRESKQVQLQDQMIPRLIKAIKKLN